MPEIGVSNPLEPILAIAHEMRIPSLRLDMQRVFPTLAELCMMPLRIGRSLANPTEIDISRLAHGVGTRFALVKPER